MNAILFEFFWYKVFVHRKLKLLKFLMDPSYSLVVLTIYTPVLCTNCVKPVASFACSVVY